jgi:hypothetical protein
MWEDILKATFTLPKGTSVKEIKRLINEAIKNPLEAKNNPFTATKNSKGAIKVNENGEIIGDGYKRRGGDSFYPVERVKSKGPPVVYETVVQAQTPLTIDEAAKHYKENVVDYDEVNPFKESETIQYREEGRRMPKKLKRRELPEDKPYLDEREKPRVESREEGKKLRAKETRDRKKRKGNFQDFKPKSNVKRTEDKLRERLSIASKELKTAEDRFDLLDYRTPSQDSIYESLGKEIKDLREEIKNLREEIKQVTSESTLTSDEAEEELNTRFYLDYGYNIEDIDRVEMKQNLPQIRTIMYPISNADFDSFIIALDKFIDGEDSPTINKYREKNKNKFDKIMELIESTSTSTGGNTLNKFIGNLKNMVEISMQTIGGEQYPVAKIKLNRQGATRATLTVKENINFLVNEAELNLPVGKRYTPEEFERVSNWMETKYAPIPKVTNYQKFMDNLVGDIFNAKGIPSVKDIRSSTTDAGFDDVTLPYMVEWLTSRNNPLLTKLIKNMSVIGGKKLTPVIKTQRVQKIVNGAEFKNKNFIPLMSRYLFDPSYKELLSKKQVERLEKLLSEKVGDDTVIGLLLLVLDQTFSVASPSKKDTIADRLGVKPKPITQPDETYDEEISPVTTSEQEEKIRSKRKEDARPKYDPKEVEDFKNKPKPPAGPSKDYRGRRDLPRKKRGTASDPLRKSLEKADISSLPPKKRREVKALLQNAHPTEYFGEDYLRLGKVINIIDGLAEDEEGELLEKLGVKNLQMVKTAASLRKKYENLYKKLYDMVYDEEE